MIWDEFLRHFRFCDEEDSGLSDEEQERKGPKIAQSTHENGYIKPRKTFWRNSKQLLTIKKLKVNVRKQAIWQNEDIHKVENAVVLHSQMKYIFNCG